MGVPEHLLHRNAEHGYQLADTLALLAASAAETEAETTIATPEDIERDVAANAPSFAGSRGRHAR